jgi:hypothetical protein
MGGRWRSALPFFGEEEGDVEEGALVVFECSFVVCAAGDDEVEVGELVLDEAEGLADAAFEAVSDDGVADFAADGEAQARVWAAGGEGPDGEGAAGLADFGVVDGLVFEVVGEAHGPREREVVCGRLV